MYVHITLFITSHYVCSHYDKPLVYLLHGFFILFSIFVSLLVSLILSLLVVYCYTITFISLFAFYSLLSHIQYQL